VKPNADFRDLLAALNAAGAEYLVVGARALAAFGAPLDDLRVDDLATAGTVFQIGVEPVRIDIVTSIEGVDFDEAWPDRISADYGDQSVNVISRKHLIQNKKASGRPQDVADVDALENLGED
jgi:hypothetical protein